MLTRKHGSHDTTPDEADEADEAAVAPLTAAQAQALRDQQPSLSPWRVIAVQAAIGVLAALAAWGLTARANVGWSMAYGALVVVVPAALFARGLMSQFASINAVTAGFGFFVWEAIKIAVSAALLVAAPRLVTDLDWLAMLIGLIVTLKVYWVALLLRPKLNKDRLKS